MTGKITYPKAGKTSRARFFTCVLGAVLCALSLLVALTAQPGASLGDTPDSETGAASEREQDVSRTVRVGFPQQKGLSETDENGSHFGYTYEYLEQVSQYTGWDYEFVTVGGTINEQLVELLAMLESGEIDIMGAMNYSDDLAEVYDFAIKPYGNAHTALFAADDNKAITDTNIYRLDCICVARVGAAPKYTAELETFCEMNDIEVELIQCDSVADQIDTVLRGDADLALGIDIAPLEGLHVVSSFTPKPFYFATTKGDRGIVSQLNEAITSIDNAEPQFQNSLHHKYFGIDAEAYGLSPEMLSYIDRSDIVRVGYTAGMAPIQDSDGETGQLRGATAGVLEHIAEYTGLVFEAVPIPSGMGVQEALDELDLDAIAGVLHDFDYAHVNGLSLSSPYVKSLTWLVMGSGVDAADLASEVLATTSDWLPWVGSIDNVVACDTLQQCIEAVNNGTADYTYADGYTAPFYMSDGSYLNITALPDSESESNVCFAFPSSSDPMLLRIMNKAIEVMPAGIVNASIYREVTDSQKPSVERFVKNYAIEILVLFLSVAAVIIALVVLYARARSKAVKVEKAEKELLRIRAERDDLTGLLGVAAFNERASALIDSGDAGAFLVLDIDDFKLVNDTFGHKRGDETLRELALAICRTFRDGDVIGRCGGDEFAVCVKGAIPKEALEDRCRELSACIAEAGARIGVEFSISIGAVLAEPNDTYGTLYDRADKAMYGAKDNGKHGCAIVGA